MPSSQRLYLSAQTRAVEPSLAWNLDVANERTPQQSARRVAQLLYPWCEGPCPAESTSEPIRKLPHEAMEREAGTAVIAKS